MAEKEYFIDDRIIITDEIKRMSKEERRAEINRLEAEAAEKHEKIIAKLTNPNKERIDIATSLFGILSDDITVEEMQKEKLELI